MKLSDDFDEMYWEEEAFGEDVVRAKCRERGIDEDKIDRLLNDRVDALDVTDADIDELEDDEPDF